MTVSAGTLQADNSNGSATGTNQLFIAAGATLSGNGVIGGLTTFDDGATLAPGNPYGTLTISNELDLSDLTLLQFDLGTNSDEVVVSGDLFLTGQLQVTAAGGFGVGTYTLFSCAGTLTYANFMLASAPAGYHYSFNTNTSGVVKLIVAPATPPNFGSLAASGASLVFSGNNGVPLGSYFVLASTNLALPPAGWTCVLTNQFDVGGNFIFTNAMNTNSAQSYYRLQLP